MSTLADLFAFLNQIDVLGLRQAVDEAGRILAQRERNLRTDTTRAKSRAPEENSQHMNKYRLAHSVAEIGLPPSETVNDWVELSMQECEATIRFVIEKYPVDGIPAVGDHVEFTNGTKGTASEGFTVIEVSHLLIPRGVKTIRAALVMVKRGNVTGSSQR